MKLIRTKNYEELSRKAANIIAAQITLKPDCLLGLATGSSPIGTYDNLVSMYESGNLDFSRVRSVNLDEYMGLGGDNDQNYRYFMNKHLFERVNIDMTNTHVPDGTVLDSEKACAAYNALLAEMGTIDLQVLGIGPNGHIGFNEPDDHFAAETHCVDLTDATIQANKRFFENEADVPRKAYTMGIGNIMSAKMIVLVANGKNKAKALAAALKGPVTPQCPASILQFHPNAIIIADEDALSELE